MGNGNAEDFKSLFAAWLRVDEIDTTLSVQASSKKQIFSFIKEKKESWGQVLKSSGHDRSATQICLECRAACSENKA